MAVLQKSLEDGRGADRKQHYKMVRGIFSTSGFIIRIWNLDIFLEGVFEMMDRRNEPKTVDEKLAALSDKMKRERKNIEADFRKHGKKRKAKKKGSVLSAA